MYEELPRFMRTFGRETIGGLPLNLLNAGGVVVGLTLGRWIGAALRLPGLLFLLATVAMIALGVVLTADYRGTLIVARAFLHARFTLHDLLGGRTVDGRLWGDVRGADEDDALGLVPLLADTPADPYRDRDTPADPGNDRDPRGREVR